MPSIKKQLKYLRRQIKRENISYGEIHQLQTLVEHIPKHDVVLLEWAGVPEFPEDDRVGLAQRSHRPNKNMSMLKIAQLAVLSIGFAAECGGLGLPIGREWNAPAVNTPIDLGGHTKRRKKSTPSRAQRKKHG